MHVGGSVLHVENWRRPEFLQFGDLDIGRRSSLIFSLLFGKRTLLVFGLDGVGNLGVDLGQGVVDEGEEVFSDVLELRRLRVERGRRVELLWLWLSLSPLVGLSQYVLKFFLEYFSANGFDGFSFMAVNGL